jgi:hypothetical protein
MSRVVALSGKDRASITMAGHRGDGVFWYEDDFGFTTYLAAGEDAAAKLAPLTGLNAKIKAETASAPLWTYYEDRALEADYQFGARTWHSKLPPENPVGQTSCTLSILTRWRRPACSSTTSALGGEASLTCSR